MLINKKHFLRLLFFTLSVAFFCSCSTKSTYELKSFIFDGVPKYEEYTPRFQDSLHKVDSLKFEMNKLGIYNINETVNYSAATGLISIAKKQGVSFHKPYKERKCSLCHNMQSTKSSQISSSDLCYKCHDNLNITYTVLHGPVASGNCLICHSPHKSKHKKLLIKSAQNLCLNCHDLDVLGDNSEHRDLIKTTCLTCHNPHGGDTNMFLVNNK